MIPLDQPHVLASNAGVYEESLPVPALRGHFRCLWTNAIAQATRLCVVPDGCADLLWREGRFTIVGPDRIAATSFLPSASIIMGLRFQPGAAHQWLGQPLSEIVGREIAMSEFWGSDAVQVADALSRASSVGEQAGIFQALMAAKVRSVAPPPREAAAMFDFLNAHREMNGGKIVALADRLNVSARTLRRRSEDYFGYGVKTLDRVLRFQGLQSLALGEKTTCLADLAAAAGYSDQAHMSREVQALTGMTAGEFTRQLGP